MEWCLQCHKNPEEYIRPRDQVFSMTYQKPADQAALGKQLVDEYKVNKRQLTNCSVCHY
jgi:cytochrome c553